jgi:hypothetical protein
MLFGHLIGADETHAFAPQTYIDAENRLKNDDFFMDHYTPQLYESAGVQEEYFDLRPLLAAGSGNTDHYIHYSREHRIDDVHAQHVAGLPRIFYREYSEGGHRIARHIRDAGLLPGILRDALEGRTVRADVCGC